MALAAETTWLNGRSVIAAIRDEEETLKSLGWMSARLQNGRHAKLATLIAESVKHPFFAAFHEFDVAIGDEHVLKRLLYCGTIALTEAAKSEGYVGTDLSNLHKKMNAFEVFELLIVDPLVEVMQGADLFNFISVTFLQLREAFVLRDSLTKKKSARLQICPGREIAEFKRRGVEVVGVDDSATRRRTHQSTLDLVSHVYARLLQ